MGEDDKPTQQERNIFGRISEIVRSHDGPLVVIGGPPCQAYSVNGRNRQRAEKNYTPKNDERFFLYLEYLKVLDCAAPDIFIMENVEGILTAEIDSGERIFRKIKRELTRPKNEKSEQYDIYSLSTKPKKAATSINGPEYESDRDYVITASDYGIPQDRKRVILLGIKKKYGPLKKTMNKTGAENVPSAKELIGLLPMLRSGLNEKDIDDTGSNWKIAWDKSRDNLIRTLRDPREIAQVADRWIDLENQKRKRRKFANLSLTEQTALKRQYKKEISMSYEGTAVQLEKLQHQYMRKTKLGDGRGSDYFVPIKSGTKAFSKQSEGKYPELCKWLSKDMWLHGAVNHKTRSHMGDDLQRYMFSAAWAKANSSASSPSPKSKNFPLSISPKHKNWESGNHADRFRTIEADMVPLTITSHLRKDGHAQIHYDPNQNRSMTVREAARIQTFPDDYYFEGSQGWQFQQVGNAVPSYLARSIALYVLDVIKEKKITE
jgi:DNA (cytosine-5)-methyltransferase 1